MMRRGVRILCLGACLGVVGLQNAQSPVGGAAPIVSKEERERRGLSPDAKITFPKVIFAAEPQLPKNAEKHKGIGSVVVHIQIDKNGNVTEARVFKGVGFGFDEQALVAARQLRFSPATSDGAAIPWDWDVEINFNVF
jgi:TonB family protein